MANFRRRDQLFFWTLLIACLISSVQTFWAKTCSTQIVDKVYGWLQWFHFTLLLHWRPRQEKWRNQERGRGGGQDRKNENAAELPFLSFHMRSFWGRFILVSSRTRGFSGWKFLLILRIVNPVHVNSLLYVCLCLHIHSKKPFYLSRLVSNEAMYMWTFALPTDDKSTCGPCPSVSLFYAGDWKLCMCLTTWN